MQKRRKNILAKFGKIGVPVLYLGSPDLLIMIKVKICLFLKLLLFRAQTRG